MISVFGQVVESVEVKAKVGCPPGVEVEEIQVEEGSSLLLTSKLRVRR